jgi:hypothetical protein
MATIELTARHNPLAWLLYFTKLTVSVDGQPSTFRWGRSEIPVMPGTHTVDVSFRYMGAQRGPASISVPVAEGTPARLRYTMPPWMYAKGRLEVVG